MKQYFLKIFWLLTLFTCSAQAAENIVNVYAWAGEIPTSIIQQFEHATGIKVNFSTYDSNETMYAKIKATDNPGYDVIEPSSYYVDRMRKENLLEKIDKTKLPNFKNLDPTLLNKAYDPENNYSIPYLWGVTGIFINQKYYPPKSVNSWQDLWQPRFKNKLMLLDDPREVFSMGLLALGYSVNDNNPAHIRQAYQKLKSLLPNVRLFNSDAMPSIPIDEDANIGMAWNGDIFRAQTENKHIKFIYPKDGFVVWSDNFAIPINAPHLANAYKFINFMLTAKVGAETTEAYGYATANKAAKKLLPEAIRKNATIFPDQQTLARGQFQTDIGDQALALYEKYWLQLKLSA